MVMSSRRTQEELKALLVSYDSSFHLVPAKNPLNTYKVLWYRLSPYRSCKVDVLQPGVMNIPVISPDDIVWKNNLPLMPFSIILLLKLQAWTDHQTAGQSYLRMKQYTDSADIKRLLPIAITKGTQPRSDPLLPSSFISAAETRVRQFVTSFPDTHSQWTALGFEAPKPRSATSMLQPSSSASTGYGLARPYPRFGGSTNIIGRVNRDSFGMWRGL